MRIVRTASNVGWSGRQTAYHDQHHAAATLFPDIEWVDLFQDEPPRWTKPALRYARERWSYGSPGHYYDSATWLEGRVMLASVRRKNCLVHLESAESQFAFLRHWTRWTGVPVIAGVHLSVGWWKMIHRAPEVCRPLDAIIALGSRQAEYFGQLFPGRVRMIKWGVDVGKFSPAEGDWAERKGPPRVIFCGQFMRDLPTLARVIEACVRRDPSIQFDLVVPRLAPDSPLRRVSRFPQVHWHAGLPVERLIALYRSAWINVMPVHDSVVNCAILEATSCGLPSVVNEYEGAVDYLRADFADVLPPEDAAGFADRICGLVQDKARLRDRSRAARNFALAELDARIGATRLVDLYRAILADGSRGGGSG